MGIFVLHNLDEVMFISQDAALSQRRLAALGIDRTWYRQDRMALATGLLTAVAHGLSRKLDNPGNSRQAFLGAAVAGAMGGNALGHMGRALGQRRYNGGLATSFVMLPLAVQVLRNGRAREHLTRRQVMTAAATGNAVAIPMIVMALAAARRVLR